MRFRWWHGQCSGSWGRHLPGHQVSLLSPAGLSRPLLSHPWSWHHGLSRAALPAASHTCCPAGAVKSSVHLHREPRVPLLVVLKVGSWKCSITVPRACQEVVSRPAPGTVCHRPAGGLATGNGPMSPALTARESGSGQDLAATGKAATGLLSTVPKDTQPVGGEAGLRYTHTAEP